MSVRLIGKIMAGTSFIDKRYLSLVNTCVQDYST
jgi:hypothetical protein